MPKQKLFDDDSEEEVDIKTENEYAKKYDAWREKEEIHKLEQKYGPNALNSDASLSSDSEDESDEPPEVSEEMEEQFLKTLSLLKTKDPRIYDPNYKFFDDKEKETVKEPEKKTLTFADSDEDDDDGNIFSIEKKADIGDETEVKPSTSGSSGKTGKEVKLKEFLTGKAEHIDDPVEKDLAPLKALWSDPNINEGEKFLRDYILNKRYLDEGEAGEAADKIRDDDDLEADEQMVEQQGQFERAYNFRFEEPDQEFLKRFPRTMNYIRPKDDKRARKRAELRTRKEEEKRRKMEEIARLKALKLKEIQEKIAKIKEVTGNEELAFKEDDIEGDFDPEEHDRRMKAIFDEQYYGEADDEKPVFPDLDEELEIENWDNYDIDDKQKYRDGDDDEEGPHCEDADFNMDADYDPKQARANLLEEMKRTLGKKRRNRKKKSKLAKLLEADKPKFVPTEADKTYSEYMEEYYKMDCEDVIGGDLPTRFKYREVVPNDYGLTVEEILLADDKELTQWVPLKKIVKHRPENVQKSEVKTYAQKAADVNLKKKILPSLFKELPPEPELVVPSSEKKKKKKKKKSKQNSEQDANEVETNENEHDLQVNSEQNGESSNNKKKAKSDVDVTEEADDNESNAEDNSERNNKAKSKKKKKKHLVEEQAENTINNETNIEENNQNDTTVKSKQKKKDKNSTVENQDQNELTVQNNSDSNTTPVNKKKKKKHNNEANQSNMEINSLDKGFKIETVQNATPSQVNDNKRKRKMEEQSNVPNKKKKKDFNNKNKKGFNNKKDFNNKNKSNNNDQSNPLGKLSDERLKAYGLNPKKYKKFLHFKKF